MPLINQTFSQLITFTRASSGTFTGPNGLIQSANTNVPRFDYAPVTIAARGLLIEEQRTNLLLRSEEFDNGGAWVDGLFFNHVKPTVAANVATAPDGSTSADQLTSTNATAATIGCAYVTGTTSTTYTVSCWVKAGPTNSATSARINLAWGSAGVLAGNSFSSAVTLTSEWQRVTFSATTSATGVTQVQLNVNLGNGTSGGGIGTTMLVWGAQLEAGSFATSYIPTVASQVTRSADVASVNTLSPWYNATEGTLYAEALVAQIAGNVGILAEIGDGTNSNRIAVFKNTNSALTSEYVFTGGVAQAALDVSNVFNANAVGKFAATYKANDFQAAGNGALSLSDTSGTVPPVTRLYVGNSIGSASFWNGWIRRITYYPRKFSSAELQAITA